MTITSSDALLPLEANTKDTECGALSRELALFDLTWLDKPDMKIDSNMAEDASVVLDDDDLEIRKLNEHFGLQLDDSSSSASVSCSTSSASSLHHLEENKEDLLNGNGHAIGPGAMGKLAQQTPCNICQQPIEWTVGETIDFETLCFQNESTNEGVPGHDRDDNAGEDHSVVVLMNNVMHRKCAVQAHNCNLLNLVHAVKVDEDELDVHGASLQKQVLGSRRMVNVRKLADVCGVVASGKLSGAGHMYVAELQSPGGNDLGNVRSGARPTISPQNSSTALSTTTSPIPKIRKSSMSIADVGAALELEQGVEDQVISAAVSAIDPIRVVKSEFSEAMVDNDEDEDDEQFDGTTRRLRAGYDLSKFPEWIRADNPRNLSTWFRSSMTDTSAHMQRGASETGIQTISRPRGETSKLLPLLGEFRRINFNVGYVTNEWAMVRPEYAELFITKAKEEFVKQGANTKGDNDDEDEDDEEQATDSKVQQRSNATAAANNNSSESEVQRARGRKLDNEPIETSSGDVVTTRKPSAGTSEPRPTITEHDIINSIHVDTAVDTGVPVQITMNRKGKEFSLHTWTPDLGFCVRNGIPVDISVQRPRDVLVVPPGYDQLVWVSSTSNPPSSTSGIEDDLAVADDSIAGGASQVTGGGGASEMVEWNFCDRSVDRIESLMHHEKTRVQRKQALRSRPVDHTSRFPLFTLLLDILYTTLVMGGSMEQKVSISTCNTNACFPTLSTFEILVSMLTKQLKRERGVRHCMRTLFQPIVKHPEKRGVLNCEAGHCGREIFHHYFVCHDCAAPRCGGLNYASNYHNELTSDDEDAGATTSTTASNNNKRTRVQGGGSGTRRAGGSNGSGVGTGGSHNNWLAVGERVVVHDTGVQQHQGVVLSSGHGFFTIQLDGTDKVVLKRRKHLSPAGNGNSPAITPLSIDAMDLDGVPAMDSMESPSCVSATGSRSRTTKVSSRATGERKRKAQEALTYAQGGTTNPATTQQGGGGTESVDRDGLENGGSPVLCFQCWEDHLCKYPEHSGHYRCYEKSDFDQLEELVSKAQLMVTRLKKQAYYNLAAHDCAGQLAKMESFPLVRFDADESASVSMKHEDAIEGRDGGQSMMGMEFDNQISPDEGLSSNQQTSALDTSPVGKRNAKEPVCSCGADRFAGSLGNFSVPPKRKRGRPPIKMKMEPPPALAPGMTPVALKQLTRHSRTCAVKIGGRGAQLFHPYRKNTLAPASPGCVSPFVSLAPMTSSWTTMFLDRTEYESFSATLDCVAAGVAYDQ